MLMLSFGTTAYAADMEGFPDAASLPATLQPDLPETPVYMPEESTQNPLGRLYRSGDAALPVRYHAGDGGLITSVKNQNPYGTCWAFSAMSACETSLIRHGLYDPMLDLSEFHFTYFFYHDVTDPLGNTAGDYNTLTRGNYMNTGGNDICSIFTLAKWVGAAGEDQVPYPGTQLYTPASSLAYQDVGHLQNARYVTCIDRRSIKKLISDYGSVSVPVYMSSDYINPLTGAYYVNTKETTNHQLVLVGWDDQYSRENFREGRRPSSDGAWIAKNSYGTDFGEQGYLYISYEDKGLYNAQSLAFAYDMESAQNYSHNYQYDGSASSTYRIFTSGGTIANVFTVKGNPGGQERLDAVSFALASSNVTYSIQIYKNPANGTPDSGIPILDSPQTGQTTYCGYYTIPLDQQIILNQGDRFSVVITLKAADGGKVYFFTDESSSINILKFVSSASKGQSYLRSNGVNGWSDLGKIKNGNIRIKAFTTDTTEAASVIRPAISKIVRPSLYQVQIKNCSALALSWSPVTYGEAYEVFRSTSKKKGYKKIAVTSNTFWTDTGRTAGKTYYYKVRACCNAKSGVVYSPYSTVSSRKLVPSKVSFKSLQKKKESAILSWKQVSGASGYEIYRRTSDTSWKRIKTVKKGSKTKYQNKVSKKGTYRYRLRAYKKVKKKKVYGPYSRVRTIKLK